MLRPAAPIAAVLIASVAQPPHLSLPLPTALAPPASAILCEASLLPRGAAEAEATRAAMEVGARQGRERRSASGCATVAVRSAPAARRGFA